MTVTARGQDSFAGQNEPAPAGASAGVTQFLYELYQRRDDLQREFPDLDGHDGWRLVEWAHVHGRDEVPIPDSLLPAVPASARDELAERRLRAAAASAPLGEDPGFGINLIGLLHGELGVGEIGRQLVRGLDAAHVPVLPVAPAYVPRSRQGHDFTTVDLSAAAFPVNVVPMNLDGLWSLARQAGDEFLTQRHSIGVWWWEVDAPIPPEWQAGADRLSELWAGTSFVADIISRYVPCPVTRVRLPVVVPRVMPQDRAELEPELPGGYRFLFLFDYHSIFTRKNPLELVDAFSAAFKPGEGASLMIKTINAEHDAGAHRALVARASEHPDVQVIDQYLSPRAKNALIASCDCYVSLHRSEGFGLTLAEAMYLGKPVIATGYSGNLDFMNPGNSHLLDYELVRIGANAARFPTDGEWAQPDLEQAASALRRMFERPDEGLRLGRRAATEIRRSHSAEASAESLSRALERARAAARSRPSAVRGCRALDLIETGPTPPPRSPLGRLSRLLRRVVLRAIKPYTAYQARVNEAFVGELRTRDAELAELRLAQARTRADALAASRRLERGVFD